MASVTIIFGGKEQATHQLDQPRMVVGREASCEIAIDNLGISRQHCVFVQKGDTYAVQDLGSSNGTYVNGRKISEHFLNDQDEVIVGKYTIRFRNDRQTNSPVAAAPAAADVPDTLNTYVMDGAKIQEQLAKMRGTNANVPKPGVGATAKDYAKAFDVPGTPQPAARKSTVTVLTVLVAVLAAALIAVLALVVYNKL
jgi:two-component system, NtrC family, sensor kinase